MGIRMHVAVGYGLDLDSIPGANKDALSYTVLEDKDRYSLFIEDVEKWAEESGNPLNSIDDLFLKDSEYFYDLMVYDDEYGFDSKLLLTPPGYKGSWTRYDDHLDSFVYEAYTDPDKWGEPEWIEKPGALYPFINLMRANPDSPLGVERYWVTCYLNHPDYKDAIPYAPFHLWFLIKHLGIWPEDRTTEAFLSLRPTLYRYWS